MENSYELMLINRSSLTEHDEKKILSKIDEFIKGKGKIHKTSNLGKKKLVYKIKKQSEGNYWLIELSLVSTAVSNFAAKLSMEEDILRYLILKRESEAGKVKSKKNKSISTVDTKHEEKVKKIKSRVKGE